MEKLFYTDKSAFINTESAILYLIERYFNINTTEIYRSEHGKPFLRCERRLFVSVAHTDSLLFIAFSSENLGIDAERLDRTVHYPPILRKFPENEWNLVRSQEDFLRLWTVKESAIKYLGGRITHGITELCYQNQRIFYRDIELPVSLRQLTVDGHVVSVCSERDFSTVVPIRFIHSIT